MADSAKVDWARGRLIAFRNDRLGARLLTLVNAMRLSADHGIDFAVHWPFATDVTAVFNDATELFEAGFVAERFIDRETWLAVRPEALRIGDAVRRDSAFLKTEAARGRAVAVDQAFGINVLQDEDPEVVRQAFVQTLTAVPFAETLRPLIDRVSDALAGATAYHIRRGDLTDGLAAKNKPWPHKVVPNEFYELHLAQALSGGRGAILFSDDAWTLEHYCQAFPTLRTIRHIVDLGELTEAQRDFIELYAMSRCAKIIAPERSAFSSTAVHMGDAVKLPVTDDMTPEMSQTAHERLIVRLRDRPDSFAGDGDIGQCLAHVGPYLAQQERWAEAASLFGAHVVGGLNIAFIYPETLRYQHRAGDVAGALATGRCLHARQVFHLRYFVEAEFLHGYAHVRAGDKQTGLRRIAGAFWHGPTSGEARILIPALVEAGVLHGGNFLPIERLHLDLHRRRGPLKQLVTQYPEMFREPGVGLPEALGSIETACWDWAPLLRSVSLPGAAKSGAVETARAHLAQITPTAETRAEHASLSAVLDAYDGDPDRAAEQLTTLTAHAPDHAMTWQRLSHALLIGRHFAEAANAAEQAAARASDVPVMRAWAGMTLLRCRQAERAAEHLRAANAAAVGFASIPALFAQALTETGATDDALAMLDQAMALAPMEAEFALQRASVLETLDRKPEAIATLSDMVERHRAPGKLFRRLVGLMKAEGDRDGAARMIQICQERFPDHPATQRLLEEQAA